MDTPDISDIRSKLTASRSLSLFRRVESILTILSPSERLALYALTALLCISALSLLSFANSAVSVSVPSQGGTLTEGIVGPARFINPVLSVSQADSDIAALVYSGLTRVRPDGTIVPDLAESFNISEDGTVYTFKLREHATFHDGRAVTSADVLFTVKAAQNAAIKSPHRADWEGVAASTPDARTVIFTLPHAYAPFLQNTTLGILPEHLWKDTGAEDFPFNTLNTRPIGSGPFFVKDVKTDETGAAMRYELAPFKDFTLGKPYLKRISLVLFGSDDDLIAAYENGRLDSLAGVSPKRLREMERTDTVITTPLPRIFGVFFNQGRAPVLADIGARSALDIAIDRERLINMVLRGYGVAARGPIPPSVAPPETVLLGTTASTSTSPEIVSTIYTQATVQAARDKLSSSGWTWDEGAGAWTKNKRELSFTLSTADAPELTETGNALAAAWRQAGVKVQVQVYPIGELNESVIRPRSYDAILFGEVVGRELDLFAFWHSSQRNDPGLNLSLYANSKADTVLTPARATIDRNARLKLYGQFADVVKSDIPAIFLYSPEFVYLVPKHLQGVSLASITSASERFLNAHEWYTDTESVWQLFTDKTN